MKFIINNFKKLVETVRAEAEGNAIIADLTGYVSNIIDYVAFRAEMAAELTKVREALDGSDYRAAAEEILREEEIFFQGAAVSVPVLNRMAKAYDVEPIIAEEPVTRKANEKLFMDITEQLYLYSEEPLEELAKALNDLAEE